MTGDDLIGAVSMVDDDLIEEAAEYKKEGKGHIVLIVSAFAASAAAIAVVNNLPGYTSDPHDFEVDNSVQTVVTTETSTSGTSDTDAVSYVSAGTVPAPFTEPGIPETEKFSDTSDSVTNEVTEAAQTESHVITEAPSVVTESPATEKIVTEAPNTEESQTLPPRPVPSPDPPVTVPERPTPMPTPMPVTTVTMPQRPTPSPGIGPAERPIDIPPNEGPIDDPPNEGPISSPDPILPVNRENNTFDYATRAGKTYSKRCVHIFEESTLDEKTLNAFFESTAEKTGVMASVKTVSGISSEDMFLLKCGNEEGKYYVFLNESLTDEEAKKIYDQFGITEYSTPEPATFPEPEQPIPTPET